MIDLKQLAARKALLVTRADLERLKVSIAVHEIRNAVSPPIDPARGAAVRPAVERGLAIAVPLFGFTRVGRVLRALSVALSAFRAFRSWSGR